MHRVGITMTSLKQARLTASPDLSRGLLEECNTLFWTYHATIQAGRTSSRTRDHQTTLIGSVKIETEEQQNNTLFSPRILKVNRSSRADCTNTAREISKKHRKCRTCPVQQSKLSHVLHAIQSDILVPVLESQNPYNWKRSLKVI